MFESCNQIQSDSDFDSKGIFLRAGSAVSVYKICRYGSVSQIKLKVGGSREKAKFKK